MCLTEIKFALGTGDGGTRLPAGELGRVLPQAPQQAVRAIEALHEQAPSVAQLGDVLVLATEVFPGEGFQFEQLVLGITGDVVVFTLLGLVVEEIGEAQEGLPLLLLGLDREHQQVQEDVEMTALQRLADGKPGGDELDVVGHMQQITRRLCYRVIINNLQRVRHRGCGGLIEVQVEGVEEADGLGRQPSLLPVLQKVDEPPKPNLNSLITPVLREE